jgi:hypothetical protein
MNSAISASKSFVSTLVTKPVLIGVGLYSPLRRADPGGRRCATAAQTETVLYSFCSLANCSDGALPIAGLIADSKGNLYGTTHNGGVYGLGTAFKL